MSVASQVNTNLNKYNLHLKMEAKRNNPFVYIKYLTQKHSCQKSRLPIKIRANTSYTRICTN